MSGTGSGLLPRRRFLLLAATAALALATAAVALGGRVQPASSAAWRVHTSAADGVTVSFPSDWHVAARRLVPNLLDPREILSLGTSKLHVGGGGNCGRYPAAALVRMGPRDRLISIQHRTPAPGPHASWFRRLDRWPRQFRLPRPARFVISDHGHGPTRRLWTSRLDLRFGGRYYWVLIAFGSLPSRAAAHEVERILETVRFEPRGRAA